MSDRTEELQTRDEAGDSIEYRLLQTYSEKKGPTYTRRPQSNGAAEKKAALPVPTDKRRKGKKKKKNFLRKVVSCIRPPKEERSPDGDHRSLPASVGPDTEVDDIVNKLTEISDSVHFQPSDLETDSGDVIERLVELLREHGDKLDEEIRNNPRLIQQLQNMLSYSIFDTVVRAFFGRISPEEVPPAEQPEQARIALVCEITSRLKIMDSHPMNRVLGFGAEYLRKNYTSWVNQQGGYGKVFSPGDEEEVE